MSDIRRLAHQFSFKAMGGPCDIDIVGVGRPERLIQRAVSEVRRIEAKFSRYLDSSVVGQINANAGLAWTSCDEETLGLLAYANTLYEHSSGLFDLTSGVLRRVWDFGKSKTPSLNELEKVLPLVGWKNIEFKGNYVRLRKKRYANRFWWLWQRVRS